MNNTIMLLRLEVESQMVCMKHSSMDMNFKIYIIELVSRFIMSCLLMHIGHGGYKENPTYADWLTH